MMDKKNSTTGRHPVVFTILVGLLLGQLAFFIDVIFNSGVQSFSGVITGLQAVLYNTFGALGCIAAIIGILRQGKRVPIGTFVIGLMTELYAMFSLGLVCIIYAFHQILAAGPSFPFILFLLSIGFLKRAWDIRRELEEIKADLTQLRSIQARGDE